MKSSIKIWIYICGYFMLGMGQKAASQSAWQAIDSMTARAAYLPDDTNKVLLYDEIAFRYIAVNPGTGKDYANKVVQLSSALKWKKGIIKGHNLQALIETNEGNYATALDILFTLLKTLDRNDHRNFGIVYINIGNNYYFQDQFEPALNYYLLALKECESIEDKKNVSILLGNIGLVQMKMAHFDEALAYHERALKLNRELGNKTGIARNIGNIGMVYGNQKKYDKAIEMYSEALKMKEDGDEKNGQAVNHENLGELYFTLYKENRQTDTAYAETYLNEAIAHLKKSAGLFHELGMTDSYQKCLLPLSAAYAAHGDYRTAYEMYIKHISGRDSIYNLEKRNEITRLELQYEYSKKEDSLRFINAISIYELNQQKLLSSRQLQDLKLAEQKAELQQLQFSKKEAELQYQKETGEKQLAISQKEKELSGASIKSLEKDNALNRLRLRQQWLFSLGSIFLLGGLGSFFIYRYNLKQSKLQAETAREKAELETRISNMALTTLRSQMNPHFIFNCLNSIRLFAAKNDSLSATNYISKFSRLMRLVLENSKNEHITLRQEIETLQLYVDMELMRFKKKLSYDIHFQNGMDTEYIEVPPMLVQPYVENAIWHGLMHKEHGGKLEIDFTEEEEMLIVKVKDNGIGRAKAAALRSRAAGHKSFAMNITKERLQMMNEKYGTEASVVINDLYESGEPCGTEVIIHIPIL